MARGKSDWRKRREDNTREEARQNPPTRHGRAVERTTEGPPRRRESAPQRPGPEAANLPPARPGEVWLYGRHPIEAALLNPDRRIKRLVGTEDALAGLEAILRKAPESVRSPEIVSRTDLDSLLGPGTVHQGLAAKAALLPSPTPEDVLRDIEGREDAIVVLLDQVTDPHNIGAVLRSAAAFGAIAIMVQDRHSPDETGVLAKAASGALERVPVMRVTNVARALQTLKDGGFWVAGLAADAPVAIGRAELPGRIVLALGAEGEGLRRLTRERCDLLVKLPMVPGGVESLNVSNACAVALYAVAHDRLEN